MPDRARFLGPLPRGGLWTPLGLTRGQFLAILALSILLFLFVDGPLWRDVRGAHFGRIAVSYGVIPPAVWLALHHNGGARPFLVLAGSAVLALVKLLLTAGLLIVLALGGTG